MAQLPFEGLVDKTDLSIEEKVKLFGPGAIAFPLPARSKGAYIEGSPFNLKKNKGWKFTYEETLDPNFQADLFGPLEKNAAIRQGGGVTQIVAFDFDLWDFEPAERFLNKNPWARENALVTVGRKGFTMWFRILGLYPTTKIDNVWEIGPEKDFTSESWEHIEWRSNGYSIIHGWHPANGATYRIYVLGSGIPEIPWSKFYCPDATFKNWPKLFESRKEYSHPRAPISKELLAQRLKIIGELFKIIDQTPDGCRVQVECPNWEAHSRDSGDGQTIVFTGADGSIPNFHCSHSHCKTEVIPAQNRRLTDAILEQETIQILNDIHDREERIALCRKFAECGNFYRRGTVYPYQIVYWQAPMEEPILVELPNFQDACDREKIQFSKALQRGKVYCTPPDRQIRKYLAQPELSYCQIVKSYSRRPLLTKENGKAKILIQTFAPELGVIVLGNQTQAEALSMDFADAKDFLYSYLGHWKFKTASDASRAIAQLLTPALLQGGWIRRPVPVFLVSSDLPAAGKTIWHQFAVKIYQEKPVIKAHGNSVVGGTDDMIRQSIKFGDTFCFVDEIKNRVISPLLNALITGEGEADVRSAFEKTIRASIDHLIVLLAGVRKDFSFEDQLSTRIMPIQILLSGYTRAHDGSLLSEWVDKNSLKLLAAIYAIIIRWVEEGEPAVESNTRFPLWSSVINGILEKILRISPCTAGLTKIQNEIANADINWLENIIEILREEKIFWEGQGRGISVSATQIREFLLGSGQSIPGEYPHSAPNTSRIQSGIISKAIHGLARHKQTPNLTIFTLGEHFVHCYPYGKNEKGRVKYTYLFSNTDLLPSKILQYDDDGAEREP